MVGPDRPPVESPGTRALQRSGSSSRTVRKRRTPRERGSSYSGATSPDPGELPMDQELLAIGAAVGARLKERKETIAVAESSAGGLISAALLTVPGASAYFLGGGVIYTQAARRGLLQVPDDAVKGIRASTEAYALVKARTIRERMGATWGLSETGASGPTG